MKKMKVIQNKNENKTEILVGWEIDRNMKRGRKVFLKQEKPEIKLKSEPGTISSRITPV